MNVHADQNTYFLAYWFTKPEHNTLNVNTGREGNEGKHIVCASYEFTERGLYKKFH